MTDIDSKGAIIESAQLTQLRCAWPQYSVLEKLNPPMKSDLACELAESRILNPQGWQERLVHLPSLWFTFNYLLINWFIMPAHAPMLEGTYYSWNYASIILQCLNVTLALLWLILEKPPVSLYGRVVRCSTHGWCFERLRYIQCLHTLLSLFLDMFTRCSMYMMGMVFMCNQKMDLFQGVYKRCYHATYIHVWYRNM